MPITIAGNEVSNGRTLAILAGDSLPIRGGSDVIVTRAPTGVAPPVEGDATGLISVGPFATAGSYVIKIDRAATIRVAVFPRDSADVDGVRFDSPVSYAPGTKTREGTPHERSARERQLILQALATDSSDTALAAALDGCVDGTGAVRNLLGGRAISTFGGT